MPVAGTENIFRALFQWGHKRSKEDFFSKSLVLILKRLQRYDEGLAAEFINSLLTDSEFLPVISEHS